MDPREVAPVVRERQLFEQLAKLRQEQHALRDQPAAPALEQQRAARLRQIDVESAAAWTAIRAARAESRAEHRARFGAAPTDRFRGLLPRKPD
ncbi:MAG TPA: hypothetical protein VIB48_21990 [Acidimicrobiia bacterium]|jgi:hypothetical protein